MELKYQIPTKAYHLEEGDEYEYDYREVTFIPNDEELRECVATLMFEDIFGGVEWKEETRKKIIACIKEYINDKGLTEKFAKRDYLEGVHEWFEKEVMENYV